MGRHHLTWSARGAREDGRLGARRVGTLTSRRLGTPSWPGCQELGQAPAGPMSAQQTAHTSAQPQPSGGIALQPPAGFAKKPCTNTVPAGFVLRASSHNTSRVRVLRGLVVLKGLVSAAVANMKRMLRASPAGFIGIAGCGVNMPLLGVVAETRPAAILPQTPPPHNRIPSGASLSIPLTSQRLSGGESRHAAHPEYVDIGNRAPTPVQVDALGAACQVCECGRAASVHGVRWGSSHGWFSSKPPRHAACSAHGRPPRTHLSRAAADSGGQRSLCPEL